MGWLGQSIVHRTRAVLAGLWLCVSAVSGWGWGRGAGARLTRGPFQVGWMMWNWVVSALATGAAVVLYDGSPLVPTPNVLWDLVDRIG